MSVVVLNERELRQCVPMDADSLAQVEKAFSWLAEGRVEMPPIMHIEIGPSSDVDIKSAYVRGLDRFAVKIASGFLGNAALGLPSSGAMVVLMSARTGFCEAVLLDNGYLTDLRTGLAGAVAARHLAVDDVRTVGVVGAGAQARYQIESLRLVRDFERLLVSGRSPERIATYVVEIRQRLGLEVEVASSLEQLVRESQLVITTTASKQPLLESKWLHPGLHITAMGSDLPGKQELDAAVLTAADLVVCDSRSQCLTHGELQHVPPTDSVKDDGDIVELGDITSGRAPGRRDLDQVTICDLTGMGVQDTAIAVLAYERAMAAQMGTPIES